jgi:CO/xanthine dehydrogenase FAD-binding subunit
MKPPPFEYHAPASVEEALELLATLGEECKLLAGGQSLVPLMNFRLAWPSALVDINPLTELAYVREDGGSLRIGAMTRQRALERSPETLAAAPLLVESLRFVGHLATRTRGTIGGSIAHADPAAEIPTVLTALRGEVVAVRNGGTRTIPVDDLFVGHFTTSLEPDELLSEVRIPLATGRRGVAFLEVARRFGDFALAGVAATVSLDGAGRCDTAEVALCGAGPKPIRVEGLERLAGEDKATVVEAAAQAAVEQAEPQGDIHGDADYRRGLVGVLTGRALTTAFERAREVTG